MVTASDMKGRAALVTGAASGLGRATAIKLAQAGADLCIVDVNGAGLEETATQIRALGPRVLVHETDLSVRDNCQGAVVAAVQEFGRLDALCNVAGILVMCNAHEMSAADYEKTLAVNFTAPFVLIQAAIPHLLEANGAVVNVSSSGAFLGESYAGVYCATKAALNHLTKSLAMEYIHKPIRFNAVAPGGMMTNIAASMRMPEGFDPALAKRYTPLRGLVEVDDVADMIAFLASDAAQGYHGACISIDKGITAG
ncbi:MAG: SDR family oxidoreductase [Bacteroidales bacterium]|nr:SDR family oxidoreductase [Bacteroidales bacterium]